MHVIIKATTAMATLDRLEDCLFDIWSLCIPETFATDIELNNLLWTIWTILGSDQDKLHNFGTVSPSCEMLSNTTHWL